MCFIHIFHFSSVCFQRARQHFFFYFYRHPTSLFSLFYWSRELPCFANVMTHYFFSQINSK